MLRSTTLRSSRITCSRACLRYYATEPSYTSDFVKIVEVGPRDGLQNEKTLIPAKTKLELIDRLALSHDKGGAGLSVVEATAFVSPKWVPQMGDAKEVMNGVLAKSYGSVSFPVLAPNLKGVQAAIEAGAKEVAIFPAASETFSQKNLNCDIKTSVERFKQVAEYALKNNVKVRGYISVVLGCPYEGNVKPSVVADIAQRLLDMGCYELSLGDTIGVGTPGSTTVLLDTMEKAGIPYDVIAMHCHDTYGQALANILRALEMGVRVVDSSVGGLGGCPYAKGATGNVATEDVVYSLHGLGLDTGVDLTSLVKTGHWINKELGKSRNESRVGRALATKWELQ